jgi:hypothetical protein
VFDQVWADRHRSRRRLLVLLGLGFVICLAFALLNGELRLESLPGSLG